MMPPPPSLCDDRGCDVALVEGIAPLRLNHAQRGGESGIANDAVLRRRPPLARNVCFESASFFSPLWRCADPTGAARPVPIPARPAAPALQLFLEPDRAEPFQQRVVAGDCTGHRRRVDAVARHAADAIVPGRTAARAPPALPAAAAWRRTRASIRRAPSRRSRARRLLVPGDVDEREQIAADAGVVLRRDVEHRAGGDGGVDGVAALRHDVESRLGGHRIAGGDDAVASEHFGASLSQPALRARSGKCGDPHARLACPRSAPDGFGDCAVPRGADTARAAR